MWRLRRGAECWKHLMCISTNGTVPLFPNLNIANVNNSYILRRGEENARRGEGRRLLEEIEY